MTETSATPEFNLQFGSCRMGSRPYVGMRIIVKDATNREELELMPGNVQWTVLTESWDDSGLKLRASALLKTIMATIVTYQYHVYVPEVTGLRGRLEILFELSWCRTGIAKAIIDTLREAGYTFKYGFEPGVEWVPGGYESES